MIPSEYKSPEGKENRMEHQQRSIDREMGELIGAFNTFTENNKRQFAELKGDMEKLSAQFTEYKIDHDKQAEKDYTYLDKKIGEVDKVLSDANREIVKRITDLEKIEAAKVIARNAKLQTPFGKFIQKVVDSLGTIVAGGVVAFIVYLLLLWITSSGALQMVR